MRKRSEPVSRTRTRVVSCSARLPSVEGYHLHSMLGQGRAAAVYLAEHRKRGGKVALKIFRGHCDEHDMAWRCFAGECAVLSAIRDDHVVRAIEHGYDAGLAYLAMEYLDGGTLRQCLARQLAPAQALALLQQAATGLAALHRASIVHRDVKPENFLLRGEVLVLADLGLAAKAGSATPLAEGRLLGTPRYVAPEQIQGGPAGTAADVYSLGVVFHEMLCGRPPFAGATALEVISQHLVAPVPRLHGSLEQYQPMLDRMLQKRPQDRPADADAVLNEIQRLACDGGDGAGND